MFWRGALAFSSLTLLSRIAGMARDIAFAAVLGASVWADVFLIAFRIPNFLRRLLAEGAFQSVFTPLYGGMAKTDHPGRARFAWKTLWIWALLLIVLIGIGEWQMAAIMQIVAPGFFLPDAPPYPAEQLVWLARIMFPYILCVGTVAWGASILSVNMRFAAAAAQPVILNLVILAVLLAALPLGWAKMATISALAYGVMGVGVLQACWIGVLSARQIRQFSPPVQNDPAVQLARAELDATLKPYRLARRIIPVILNNGALQAMTILNTALASLLGGGVITHLYLADRLVQLPLALIGIALSTALLPVLSQQSGAQQRTSFAQSLLGGLILGLPAAVGLIVLAEPIIALLFGHGAFVAADVTATTIALQCYSLGLLAFILNKIYSSRCYARGDTHTPMYVAGIGLAANAVVAIALYKTYQHAGLALATSLGGWIQLLLFAILAKKQRVLSEAALFRVSAWRVIILTLVASAGMGIWVYFLGPILLLAQGDLAEQMAKLCLLIASGVAAYAGIFLVGILLIRRKV